MVMAKSSQLNASDDWSESSVIVAGGSRSDKSHRQSRGGGGGGWGCGGAFDNKVDPMTLLKKGESGRTSLIVIRVFEAHSTSRLAPSSTAALPPPTPSTKLSKRPIPESNGTHKQQLPKDICYAGTRFAIGNCYGTVIFLILRHLGGECTMKQDELSLYTHEARRAKSSAEVTLMRELDATS
ncbi:hypothetical protein L1987_01778 [Smallanthus sonchifolius]|uniref:Uncharacterized protein n=1 Tax=Smallanthus sonchifolius TaxID=185202 RepID=A0ACB9K668_9ASTR|nr:hypothetical protein L1987_01778 [Smallanthus sonchifolius]